MTPALRFLFAASLTLVCSCSKKSDDGDGRYEEERARRIAADKEREATMKSQQERIDRVLKRLADARTEKEREEARAEFEALRKPAPPPGQPAPAATAKPKAPCTCTPGDPLCACPP